MPSKLNELLLEELKEIFRDIPCGVFVDYTGLTAQEADALRGTLQEKALEMKIIKNRIAKLAFASIGGDGIGELLKGPIAVVFSKDDPVNAAKAAIGCIGSQEKLQLRGGFVEGRPLTPDQVIQLSKMPSKQELLGQILAGISGPAQSIVSCFDGLVRRLDVAAIYRELAVLFDAYHAKLKEEGSS